MGVVFRRGPSKQVQLIRWNTENDTFEEGQWLKGKIDASGVSLSPNGRYLVYSAFNGRENYSVVSRPPYLTALAIWFHQGSYEARGGSFASDARLWVPEGVASRIEFRADRHRCPFTIGAPTAEEVAALDVRPSVPSRLRGTPHPKSGVILWETERPSSGAKQLCAAIRWGQSEHTLAGLDWVEFDHQGRIVYAQEGCLYRVEAATEGGFPARKLVDLGSNTFSPVEAPAWARDW